MNKTFYWRNLVVCALFLFSPIAAMANEKETGVQEQSIIDTNKAAEQAHEVVAEASAQNKNFSLPGCTCLILRTTPMQAAPVC